MGAKGERMQTLKAAMLVMASNVIGGPALRMAAARTLAAFGWETISWWPTARHAAALCVRRDPAGPLHIERGCLDPEARHC